MEELLIKILLYLGILLFLISIVSVILYRRGMKVTRKSIFISAIFMLLGFVSWAGVVYILKPDQFMLTIYSLLLGVCVTGILSVYGIISLALKEKIDREKVERLEK